MKALLAVVPLILVLILGASCSQTLVSGQGRKGSPVPPDFALTYRRGPAHADWGGAVRLTLSADGAYTLEMQSPSRARPGGWESKAQGTLGRRDMAKIYRAVQENGFWDLQSHYRNPDIIDGTVGSLRVVARGRSKRVVLSNTSVPQVAAILNVLRQTFPKEHRQF